MRRLLLFLVIALFCSRPASAQWKYASADSLRSLLLHDYASPSPARNSIGIELLTRQIPGKGIFDSVRDVIIVETDRSRDRAEMCRVNLEIASIYVGYGLAYDVAAKSKPYIDRAQSIAEEAGLDVYKAGALVMRARFELGSTRFQQALDFNNQAIAIALSTGNDSLIAIAYGAMSYTQDYLGNKLSRLQALLSARSYADKTGILVRKLQAEMDLAVFYRDLEQREKSRDFYTDVIKTGTPAKEWRLVIDAYRGMGMTYRLEHQKTLALASYDSALSLAKRLAADNYRINVLIDLLNYYFNEETAEKGLAYLNGNADLKKFIEDIGVAYQLNKLYAAKSENEKHYDSAEYYMKAGAPFEYGQPQAFHEKYEFSWEWARILTKAGKKAEALKYWLMAKNYADSSGDLDQQKDISEKLDSAYAEAGDYKSAFQYYNRYNQLRDTLENLGRQKDLMAAEIQDAGKRAELDKKEQEEKLRRRDNLQYMGMTAAIAVLFIILIVLGVFRMSVSVIKALGFFSFIFLFEFITLLLDTQIHELTHGEPWKVLAIKIVLIAMLLPLHHYLEHRAVHFLTAKAHMLRKNFRVFRRTHPPEKTQEAQQ